MKTVMEMAKEAGFMQHLGVIAVPNIPTLERFVDLIRAEEAAKYKWDIHSCGPDCKRYACASMREAVAKEREACAKVCDARYMGDNNREDMEAKRCAEAIRARGTK